MWRPFLFLLTLALAVPVLAEPSAERLRVPLGFSIALWAKADNARQLALGGHDATGGTVYVGSMRAGKVHAVRFDSAMLGFGGCPFAEDELVGNISTESLLDFLRETGVDAGLHTDALADALRRATRLFGEYH